MVYSDDVGLGSFSGYILDSVLRQLLSLYGSLIAGPTVTCLAGLQRDPAPVLFSPIASTADDGPTENEKRYSVI